MDALLRPGFRLSVGVVRAANASSFGINPTLRPGRLVSRSAPSALSRSHVAALRLRMYSTDSNSNSNSKPPSSPPPRSSSGPSSSSKSSSEPSSSSASHIPHELENSPFAHLLKKVQQPAPEKPAPSHSDAETAHTPTSSDSAAAASSTSKQKTPSDSASPLPFKKETLHRNLQDTRKILSERFSVFMDNVQNRLVHASATLNTLTGYTPIEAIKHSNAQLETALADAQRRVRSARSHYKTMHTRRAATQHEVTTLLARKDVWTPADLERFTTLYRADHEMESQVTRASEDLVEAETEEQTLSAKLNQGILRRYHEEQVWSDRIRRASTWGTWGLMGVNILLFLVLQFIAEPWKRNRLVKGVVAEEKAVLEEVRDRLDHVMHSMEENLAKAQALAHAPPPVAAELTAPQPAAQEPEPEVPAPPVKHSAPRADNPSYYYFPLPAVALSWKELFSTPKIWREVADDLCSEREVELRMRDATALVLEGMAFGTVVTATVAAVVMGFR
ncbi:hypothetical protein TD95_005067 [Thielaviopsis punctulata]|uniref:Sensitive to high expression protein 9, mitochondrial n=1 Tax=Thielaviopsis punctulata TaxID=72032 RepID=A0A0F4ZJL6_9PEZI|nr:hypothetical protein TD95_005067 [Thielaviopsis punctulata]